MKILKSRITDLIIVVLILFFIFVSFALFSAKDTQNPVLNIYKSNELIDTIPLNEPFEGIYMISEDYKITKVSSLDEAYNSGYDSTYNYFEIKNGTVSMLEASCPDKICVKHVPISKKGESIICLPNEIVLGIDGLSNTNDRDEITVDAFTN